MEKRTEFAKKNLPALPFVEDLSIDIRQLSAKSISMDNTFNNQKIQNQDKETSNLLKER